MRKNNEHKRYTQEDRETLWTLITAHTLLKPKLDTDNISTWSRADFKAYRTWSHEQDEMRRLFDLH